MSRARVFGCRALACVLAAAALLAPYAPARGEERFPPHGDPASAERRTLTLDGRAHHYLIQPVAAAGRHPVVILLHGGTEDAAAVWRQTSLPTLAARAAFIMVAPDASAQRHWNDGRGAVIGGEGPSEADDVAYLTALVGELLARDRGDPDAVFMAGVSNGGFMTIRFACEAGGLLRAAANVISELPAAIAARCRPARPLPWLSMNGDRDPLVPFAGVAAGTIVNGRAQPASLSADATFAFFAEAAQCAAAFTVETVPHHADGGDSTAERRVRSRCAGDTTSTQYVLHGAGHTLPGTEIRPLVARLLGGQNHDVDTGTVLWEHFRQTLPRAP